MTKEEFEKDLNLLKESVISCKSDTSIIITKAARDLDNAISKKEIVDPNKRAYEILRLWARTFESVCDCNRR